MVCYIEVSFFHTSGTSQKIRASIKNVKGLEARMSTSKTCIEQFDDIY